MLRTFLFNFMMCLRLACFAKNALKSYARCLCADKITFHIRKEKLQFERNKTQDVHFSVEKLILHKMSNYIIILYCFIGFWIKYT